MAQAAQGALLLAGGAPGCRSALPNSRIMIHQPSGGAQGMAQIVDDVIANHLANPVVKPRFENVKDLGHLRQMALDFFTAGAGGPATYTGKDMVQAHRGMNISEQEYMAAMDDILAALAKNGIDPATCGEVTAVLYSLKAQVIRV